MKRIIDFSIIVFMCFFLVSCDSFKKYLNCFFSDDDNEEYILSYLVDRDEKKVRGRIKSNAICMESKRIIEVDMKPLPIYTKSSQGTCTALDLNVDNKDECSRFKEPVYKQGSYYLDNKCLNSVAFETTDYKVFCNEIIPLDKPKNILGNAAVWQANDSPINNSPTAKWTLPYGVRVKMTNETLKENFVPFMKRINYKTVKNVRNSDQTVRGSGTCKLEMRVYKKDIAASNLQPLVSLHGGSWKYRSAGYAGLESSISQYTEQGFIVFAPFYRLTGDKEANAACNKASWQDMIADVEDALKWVWRNGQSLGAIQQRPIALTGQSAGAHLAMWLLAHPERHSVPVSRALLFYPPTDFKDFVSRAVVDGQYAAYTDGIETFENFFAVDDIRKVSADDLAANSFPDIVRHNTNIPPVFIIHGFADKTVPSMQSVRLCNAYDRSLSGTDYDNGPAVNDGGDPDNNIYMREYDCGAEGKLHLFAEADHMFDLACKNVLFCQAGNKKSIPALQSSFKAGRNWLMQ